MEGATRVLIIDDDPAHLRIYGWILSAAGYEPLPALVTAAHIDFPETAVDLALMDYRLTGQMTAREAAMQTRQRYPEAPIIVLSDMYDLPPDVAPFVQAFARKGEPAKLVEMLAEFARRGTAPDSAA